ncbi:pantoate--beta-alanine ligase [Saccharopolyspora rhizosphaerae]|uniref:Pantothenate synthetase n=1 Tax=Saccharopolyspora rhizosphaerae TaxID=2492662 RepID=A0A3R8P5Z5_9PSEU|nr:pantoate--beta-alanine ligase [Saccharopolyspora rhizosphaerae]RRO17259.1 pantoate--beta-alanine ligase [Saccharopolyspora rhizosphaerae]
MTNNPGYQRGELTVHSDPAELAQVTRALRATGRRVHLVPTMGALHRGHLELIKRAKQDINAVVVVSIFVNPLQFGPNEDFDRYPRTFESDVEACREAGVGLVFAPTVEGMYADGRELSVHAGPLGEELEGASRKGHFDGMLTVVLKLLTIVRPDLAFFGEKDYQQLVLIRKMARQFNLDSQVQGIPTVRESDGLALSSRNAYLDEEQRRAALALSASLTAGAHAASGGPEAVLAAAREVLATEPLVEPDYLELRDPELGPAPASGEARLLVAAKVGSTRLIDNALVLLGE